MGSKVHLIRHLDADELHRRYKEAKDAIERTHLQIIWLLTSGRSAQFVAAVTGYTPRWISILVGRYNEAGVAGLGDQRQFNPGSRPLLDANQQRRLRDSLEDPPPDYGLWTGRSVAQWITGMLGRLVAPRRGAAYLRRLGFTRQVPRPHHAEGDPLAQEVFKARFRRRVQALQQEDPGTPLEVWAMDEHRVGLKPVLRRVWAPRGRRPVARGHHRFEWMYVYGFVRPSTGEVVWFLADGVGAALFSRILAAFARDVGAGANKRVLLVLDGAGCRASSETIRQALVGTDREEHVFALAQALELYDVYQDGGGRGMTGGAPQAPCLCGPAEEPLPPLRRLGIDTHQDAIVFMRRLPGLPVGRPRGDGARSGPAS